MKNLTLKPLLFCAVLAGLATGKNVQAQNIAFTQATEEEANALNVKASDGVPLFADFDHNGFMDIYATGQTYEWLPDGVDDQGEEKWKWTWYDGHFLVYNNGGSNFVTQDRTQETGLPTMYGSGGSKAIDFNQDGHTDFLFLSCKRGWTGVAQDALVLVKNNGDGTFTTVKDEALAGIKLDNNNYRPNQGRSLNCMSIADYNKDGYPDVLIQYEAKDPWERATKLLKNVNGERFELVADAGFIPQCGGSVSFGDFNNDGWPDIVTTGWVDKNESIGLNDGGDQMHFYRNTKDGRFELATKDLDEDLVAAGKKWGFGGDAVMYVIDYDQDGKQDILCIGGVGGDHNGDKAHSQHGKRSLLLRNVSTDHKFAFEEFETNIYPGSGQGERLSELADFNGDGWVDYLGYGWNGDWVMSASNSKGAYDQFDIVPQIDGLVWKEGYMTHGDINGDGLLDLSTLNGNDRIGYSKNTTAATNVQKPNVPTEVAAIYDKDNKTITVTWTGSQTPSGSKAFYNLYLKNETTGKTFMIAPAHSETGTQSAYTAFSGYVPTTNYTFEGVEKGRYTVGVQAVTYSWQASAFATTTIEPAAVEFVYNEDESFEMFRTSHRTVPLFADFDNDGFMDLYYGGTSNNFGWQGQTVAWYGPNGERQSFENNGLPKTAWGLGSKAFDFNQDGNMDFIFLNSGGNDTDSNLGIVLTLNNGDGTFQVVNDEALAALQVSGKDGRWFNEGCQMHCLSIADYNKDGYPDLVVEMYSDTNGRLLKVLKNIHGEKFETQDIACFVPISHGSVSFGDFNNDGWADIVATGWTDKNESLGWNGGNSIFFYRNTKDGNFELVDHIAGDELNSVAEICNRWGFTDDTDMNVVDFDQDGKVDIVLTGSWGSEEGRANIGLIDNKYSAYLKNTSEDGTAFSFVETAINLYPASNPVSRLSSLADFNGDGFVDLITKGWNGDWVEAASMSTALGEYHVVKNNLGIKISEGAMSMGDINGDGLLDFVTSEWGSHNDQIMFSKNSTFAPLSGQPGMPADLKAEYNADTKQIDVTWTGVEAGNGSKPMYNLYVKNTESGKVFMLAPANLETGKQKAYTEFSSYALGTHYTIENIESGNYIVGVQAVNYAWLSSEFATTEVSAKQEGTPSIQTTSIAPAPTERIETAFTFTVTFDQPIIVNTAEDAPKASFMNRFSGQITGTVSAVEGAENQILVTLEKEVEDQGMYMLTLPEKLVFNAAGDWNTPSTLSYTVTGKQIQTTTYEPTGITPNEGEVTSLKDFIVQFAADTYALTNIDSQEQAYLINNDDQTTVNAMLDICDNYNEIKVELAEEVTAKGSYTLIIPAKMIQQGSDMFGSKVLDYAPELKFTFTVGGDGIQAIIADGQTADIYTVNGILVKKAATRQDVKALKKGLYVINGKTVLVK